MLSKIIENALGSININTITDIFIIITIILLTLSIVWTKQDKHHEFTSYAPSLLTSVGILGTFTGIVVGLLSFDVANIDGSITHLLEGLKVAFITSLVGMLSSIFLKFLTSSNVISPKQKENIKADVSMEDLYSMMSNQNENLIKLQKSLSDNSDSSLVGQIKLMRSDMSDNNKIINKNLESIQEPLKVLPTISNTLLSSKNILSLLQEKQTKQQELFTDFSQTLWIKLQDFADMLSKSATEQVIEALKNVITEFNNKLTEQFGENFKELNIAVKELVTWQENYKIQLGEMKEQFTLSVTSMSDMEKSIELISNSSKTIPESMHNLETVLTTNQHQVDELSRHLEAFKDIRDRAVEAVPEIRTQIDNTIKGIHDASSELIEGVTSSTEKMSTVMIQSADDFANNVSATNGALIESSTTLSESSTKIKDQLSLTVQDIDKHVREMVENLSQNSKEVSNNFKEIGTSLEKELSTTNAHLIENLKLMIQDIREHSKSVNNDFKENSESIGKEIQNLSSKTIKSISGTSLELQTQIENLSKEQLKQTNKVLVSLDSSIEKTINDTAKSLSNQIKTMDKVTAQEIENVMNAMGKALGSITGQFTSDYQKLVNEMKKIVETHR